MKLLFIKKINSIILVIGMINIALILTNSASAQQFNSIDEILSNTTNHSDFSALCYGANSTAYLNSNGLSVIGNPPILNLDIDGNVLTQTNIAGIPSEIKFIRIRINNPSQLNMPALNQQLSVFANLKYILVESSFELTTTQLNALQLPTSPAGVVGVYSIAIPH